MKHAAALERAGIPAERQGPVSSRLERVFGVYERRMLQPKDSIETLERVAATATKLRGLIGSLSDDVQFSLGLVTDANEDDLLGKLIERAKLLQDAIRKPVGRQRDALDGLLFDVVELWRREMPNTPGIEREHPTSLYLSEVGGETGEESGARTRGPLLDLAVSLLDEEEIDFTSKAALGRRLYTLVSENPVVAAG